VGPTPLSRFKLISQAKMSNINLSKFSDLEQAILKTLAFFEIFNYPLTLVEIHKWLYHPAARYSLVEILQALKSDNLQDKVYQKFGFYFIAGHAGDVDIRLDRYSIAENKFRIARRFARWIDWLTFVKMIAVCNNVGYNNATAKSDIDYFIVVDRGRIWWSRLVITLVATILRLRRHGNKFVDRVCLSFYIGQDHLNLSDIALKPADPYLVYWFATLAPIFDDDTYDKFLSENSWFKSYLPNFYPTVLNHRRSVQPLGYARFSRRLGQLVSGGALGGRLESFARLVQVNKVKAYLGESLNQRNTNVVISSSMLKFHKIDRRQLYRSGWEKNLNNL